MTLPGFLVWLCRLHHCRGFGIQSPTDYRFVRYVINEHYPYYAYKDIKSDYSDTARLVHKLGKLYFRIANYIQPAKVAVINPDSSLYNIYINNGCRKAIISNSLSSSIKYNMLILTLSEYTCSFCDSIFEYLSSDSVLILQNINDNKSAKQCWEKIRNHPKAIITYDLYYVGIVFLDDKRYKQHYIINF